ncbi:hypothetical protein RHAL1_03882 [Beijerinckiaceae bacterium RH AL1]|nr:hypothetical protein [Beijerinckiaceae bacterium]VVB49521.1 hypothetical protein RHCH11_RHCH11_03806 [Beijerinckiaceae bacterium RH CH11]VVB49601.1 hypothetical protein RHAL8_03802 [Beijerinckiaceae bacterium RH AL8]VVC56946.1 hypothetical protein RHAL1_03882 [Beijerinckiaceae bacterium RH AL1]
MHDRYLLHIRKTGGMAIKAALRPHAERIVFGRHDLTLVDVPAGAKALFCVRHPCQRFVSGFNSRLRKGLPRNFREWTADEAWAFKRFTTPNALAEALSSEDATRRGDAERAMIGIAHTGMKLSYWLLSASYVRKRRDDILWIGHQPSLDADFSALARLLGLPGDVALPDDDVDAHRTPAGYETALSPLGEANIAGWYRKDFEIYAACLELREALLTQPGSSIGA